MNGIHKVIEYADDLALREEKRQLVIVATSNIKIEAAEIGLSNNHDKTEYVHMRSYEKIGQKRKDMVVGYSIFKAVA